jgi:GDSL-like Lipase/Acylhydrolase family
MFSAPRVAIVVIVSFELFTALPTSAQINFEKSGYYLSLGDSVAAGEGALPVTHGFVYQLYDRGVFGRMQVMDFSNVGIKGVTADEVLALQVPEALCIQPPRIGVAPSVITLTAGANDFFVYIATYGVPADPQTVIPIVADAIAAKVANIIRSLVFGMAGLPAYCAQNGIPGIRVLAFNYYSFNHPDPQINFVLDLAVQSFSAGLQTRIAQIQADIQTAGKTARVGFVDTFSAMEGRRGLLLIEKRNGFVGGFEFEIHPTNAGHRVIAGEFERVWNSLR